MQPLDITAIPQGAKIIKNHLIFDKFELRQYRFPKSKKSRIRKKWRKKVKNYKSFFVSFTAIKISDEIHVSEKGYEYLSENLKSK